MSACEEMGWPPADTASGRRLKRPKGRAAIGEAGDGALGRGGGRPLLCFVKGGKRNERKVTDVFVEM